MTFPFLLEAKHVISFSRYFPPQFSYFSFLCSISSCHVGELDQKSKKVYGLRAQKALNPNSNRALIVAPIGLLLADSCQLTFSFGWPKHLTIHKNQNNFLSSIQLLTWLETHNKSIHFIRFLRPPWDIFVGGTIFSSGSKITWRAKRSFDFVSL